MIVSFDPELIRRAKKEGLFLFRFEMRSNTKDDAHISASGTMTRAQRKQFLKFFKAWFRSQNVVGASAADGDARTGGEP